MIRQRRPLETDRRDARCASFAFECAFMFMKRAAHGRSDLFVSAETATAIPARHPLRKRLTKQRSRYACRRLRERLRRRAALMTPISRRTRH